jgi:hypothetical protein
VFFSLGVENRGEGTLDEADQAYQLSAIGISHVSVDLSIFLVLLYFYIYFLIIKREFFDFMFFNMALSVSSQIPLCRRMMCLNKGL